MNSDHKPKTTSVSDSLMGLKVILLTQLHRAPMSLQGPQTI